MKKMKIQEPSKFNCTAEQLTSALKEQPCFGAWDMEFNSNEEYLKAFPLKGPTFGLQRFADSDSEDCQSLPQIVMQEACQEGNVLQEPYIEQECDSNVNNDQRKESQDLVLDEDLAPVQESETAELVSQQVDNEMVAALDEITLANGSDEVEDVIKTSDLMIDAVEKTTISETSEVEETVDLMVGVVEETTPTITTITRSENFDDSEGPTIPIKEVTEEIVMEPTSRGDLKLEEETIDWMVDVVAAMAPSVANLGLGVEESSTIVTKEIMEETSVKCEVEQGEVGETAYHVMMHHVEKRPIGDSIVKLEEAIKLMADVVEDENIEVVQSSVAMDEFGNISTVQAEGGVEEEAKCISCCTDKNMDSR